jgi:hypothetical protein
MPSNIYAPNADNHIRHLCDDQHAANWWWRQVHTSLRYLQWDRHYKRILVFLVLAILTPPAQARQTEQARTQFKCATTKVIMTNKTGQTGSVQVEEHMTFWIDDTAKTFIFSDGQWLRISRFDKSWISASSEDIQYEFNRADRTLTYAGSTTKDNVTTTIVGSGLCEDASTEKT